jgi:hypothetical protein
MKLYKLIENIVGQADFKNIDKKVTGIKYEYEYAWFV